MSKKRNDDRFNTIIGLIFILAMVWFFFGRDDTKNEEQKNTEITTAQQTSAEEPKELVKYDVAKMNVKITDSFNESVDFNNKGEDGYEWTAFVHELELQKTGAVHVTVKDNFLTLNESQKTEVLNWVSSSVNMVVFLETSENKPYFITAYDMKHNRIAQSKMTDVLKYKFY